MMQELIPLGCVGSGGSARVGSSAPVANQTPPGNH